MRRTNPELRKAGGRKLSIVHRNLIAKLALRILGASRQTYKQNADRQGLRAHHASSVLRLLLTTAVFRTTGQLQAKTLPPWSLYQRL